MPRKKGTDLGANLK